MLAGVMSWDDPTSTDIKASASLLALSLPKMTPFILNPRRVLPANYRQPRRRRPVDGRQADARPRGEHELLRRGAHFAGPRPRPAWGLAAHLGDAGT